MEQLTKNQAVATSQEAVQNQNEPQLRDENAHNDKSVHGVLNPTYQAGLRRDAVRSEERFSRNAETELVCRLLLEKKKSLKLITHDTAVLFFQTVLLRVHLGWVGIGLHPRGFWCDSVVLYSMMSRI